MLLKVADDVWVMPDGVMSVQGSVDWGRSSEGVHHRAVIGMASGEYITVPVGPSTKFATVQALVDEIRSHQEGAP